MARKKTLIFSADDGAHGPELWITDGTAQGTRLLKDINPGPGRSDFNQVAALSGGLVVFSAKDFDAGNPHGDELWITDGTKGGTRLVEDIEPGSGGSVISYLTSLGNGTAIFKASTTAYGGELWVTDGTAKGTKLVKDIFTGEHWDPFAGKVVKNSSSPSEMTLIGKGQAVFQASSAEAGMEIWITDGTRGGTSLLKDIVPGTGGSGASDFLSLDNGKVIFSAWTSATGGEMWVTNGTEAGTKLLKDINPGSSGASLGGTFWGEIALVGKGRAVFSAYSQENGQELWVTNGTAGGTKLVKDINPNNPGPGSGGPMNMTATGKGDVLFLASDGVHGAELWITDGTVNGTKLIKDINDGSASSGPAEFFSLDNGKFLFTASDADHGRELWITNGTGKGTSLLKDINRGEGDAFSSVVYYGLVEKGKAVFAADDGKHGVELWLTDGTAKGTRMLKDINPGDAESDPYSFTDVGAARAAAALVAHEGEGGLAALQHDRCWAQDDFFF